MKEYCFFYWLDDGTEKGALVRVELGACRSVKAASLRVLTLFPGGFSHCCPKVFSEYRNQVGVLLTVDGWFCGTLYQSSPGVYRWRDMQYEIA